MTDSGGSQYLWTCPACKARVPLRVGICRCGHKRQPPVESTPVVAASEVQPRQGNRVSPVLLLAFGAAIGLGGAVLALRSNDTAAPPHDAAPAAVRTTDLAAADSPSERLVPPVVGTVLLNKPETASSDPAAPPASIEDIVSAALPAVASIDAGNARGSGFFISRDSLLTNAHVIDGKTSVQVNANGAQYTARVVSQSAGIDMAVLQVYNPNANQPILNLGSVGNARVGEEVIAIGYALGALSNTVTRGIVSAVRKTGSVTLIQTDAAINPGNSGGPLLDRKGQVIGINSMAVSKQVGEGLGFAISIDDAVPLIKGQSPLSTTTPMAGLNQVMGGPSDGDATREQGARRYEQVLQAIARSADQVDSNWERNARYCVASAAQTGGDRPWFATYVANGVRLALSNSYDCFGWFDNVKAAAGQIKDAMDKGAELARRDGVYPGTIREIRRKYRLDWSGWDQ